MSSTIFAPAPSIGLLAGAVCHLPERHRVAGSFALSCISANDSSRPSCVPWSGCSFSPSDFGRCSASPSSRPYEAYVLYEVYITPGLMAMIQLFNGMQSSLSMVYDREMGNMRTLLVSPLPRWYLLSSKLVAGAAVSLLQVYAFLAIAWLWEIEPPLVGYLTVLPALVLSGLMLGALGMLLSSAHQAARELRGRDEFRDLSDVLCLIRTLPAMAGERSQAPCCTRSASSIPSRTPSSLFASRSMANSTGLALAVVLWMHSTVHGRRDPGL